jgi:tRNA pseudouridine55 synthase
MPRHHLGPDQLSHWRCGRALATSSAHPAAQPLAVLGPDGSLAGIARADGAGWLLPRLVFDAAG